MEPGSSPVPPSTVRHLPVSIIEPDPLVVNRLSDSPLCNCFPV